MAMRRVTRRHLAQGFLGLSILLGVLLVSTAGFAEQETDSVVADMADAPPALEPGRVLTGKDMDRLREERRDMIERPSPLGEERDPVDDVRKSVVR